MALDVELSFFLMLMLMLMLMLCRTGLQPHRAYACQC